MTNSSSTGPELRSWLRWASEEGIASDFVHWVADAGCLACWPDYALLPPVLLELKQQYHEGLGLRRVQKART
jgi:hypothetical protein